MTTVNSPINIWAVIPIKNFDQAKMRLSDVLDADQRRTLCQAMLGDVLDAACNATSLRGVLVVSCEPSALKLANDYGAQVLIEPTSLGLNVAVKAAGEYLQSKGCSGMMVIPGDVPLISADEIDEIISIHDEGSAVTLIPAWDDGGTNGMVITPCDIIDFKFGGDSFDAHKVAAENAGLTPTIINSTGLELDLDTPDDLTEFLNTEYQNLTSDYLTSVMMPPALKRGLG